ncbi:hypothetical protein [Nakamurella aerolata]|uniref:Uncharacterized protein n=1 Tax=Nakamurella aerolata TaxID=1656892 RepID=A0A849AAY7_9ACTN|nr:hypothetical protein [Nakamurella aerolata]NNG36308.1 hypothetical protein [Nakamurella aerolata]
MSTIGELGETLALDPNAPRPPFPLALRLPSAWSILDTNPQTWERSAERMIDTTFHGSRLPAGERRQVMGFFEQLVADCQRAGASVSLILVGRLADTAAESGTSRPARQRGRAASLGLHLAFRNDNQPATVGRIRDQLPRTGTITDLQSGVGPALLHAERTTMVPPGASEVVALTSLQAYIPIPDTSWTAIFASASAFPELTPALQQLLTEVVADFRLADSDTGPASGADAAADGSPAAGADGSPAPDESAGYERRDTRKGPGIERGFTTFVQRRLTGGQPDADNRADPGQGQR